MIVCAKSPSTSHHPRLRSSTYAMVSWRMDKKEKEKRKSDEKISKRNHRSACIFQIRTIDNKSIKWVPFVQHFVSSLRKTECDQMPDLTENCSLSLTSKRFRFRLFGETTLGIVWVTPSALRPLGLMERQNKEIYLKSAPLTFRWRAQLQGS